MLRLLISDRWQAIAKGDDGNSRDEPRAAFRELDGAVDRQLQTRRGMFRQKDMKIKTTACSAS
jgi:hypothetical protein